MKGLGIIIQESYFKAAFPLCEGNFSVMLLGELGDRDSSCHRPSH